MALEWCHRRLLARIHRLTSGGCARRSSPSLRRIHAVPLPVATFAPVRACTARPVCSRWSSNSGDLRRPHRRGTRKLLRIRMGKYAPEWLDRSVPERSGELGPSDAASPADQESSPLPGRRVVPTSVAPVSVFARDRACGYWRSYETIRGGTWIFTPPRRIGAEWFAAACRNEGRVFSARSRRSDAAIWRRKSKRGCGNWWRPDW